MKRNCESQGLRIPGAGNDLQANNGDFVHAKKDVFRFKVSGYCHDLNKIMDSETVCCDVKCRFASICQIFEMTMSLGRAHA
jgi:hypothetical protein